MTKALFFTDPHFGGELKIAKNPETSPLGDAFYSNRAGVFTRKLVGIANDRAIDLILCGGDFADWHDSAQRRRTNLESAVAAVEDLQGCFHTAIGNRDPKWAMAHHGFTAETHIVPQATFRSTDIVIAQPRIETTGRGMEFHIDPSETLDQIAKSTADNLILLQHWSVLRKTEKGLLTIDDPYRFTPDSQPVMTELESRAAQGASVLQISGDEHCFMDRTSPAGVRYIICPSFTQNDADNPREPCAIFGAIKETRRGLDFSFQKIERVTQIGPQRYRVVGVPTKELTRYCKTNFDPYFAANFEDFTGWEATMPRPAALRT